MSHPDTKILILLCFVGLTSFLVTSIGLASDSWLIYQLGKNDTPGDGNATTARVERVGVWRVCYRPGTLVQEDGKKYILKRNHAMPQIPYKTLDDFSWVISTFKFFLNNIFCVIIMVIFTSFLHVLMVSFMFIFMFSNVIFLNWNVLFTSF